LFVINLANSQNFFGLGAVDKRRPQSGGGGFVQCEHFADKGVSSDTYVRTFWRKKFGIFLKFMVCLHEQGKGA